jgi:hypothetical protein
MCFINAALCRAIMTAAGVGGGGGGAEEAEGLLFLCRWLLVAVPV